MPKCLFKGWRTSCNAIIFGFFSASFGRRAQRAQRSKTFEISSENEIFVELQASHPLQPYFLRGGNRDVEIEISSEIENFDRDQNCLIVGPSGKMITSRDGCFLLTFDFPESQDFHFLLQSPDPLDPRRVFWKGFWKGLWKGFWKGLWRDLWRVLKGPRNCQPKDPSKPLQERLQERLQEPFRDPPETPSETLQKPFWRPGVL